MADSNDRTKMSERIINDMMTRQPCALKDELKNTPFSEQMDIIRKIVQEQPKTGTHIQFTGGTTFWNHAYYDVRLRESELRDLVSYQADYDMDTGKVTTDFHCDPERQPKRLFK